jgi:glycosyltransferase involved in cell wall biosynthesis
MARSVSVVIPTRNRKEGLDRVIRSVLDQTVACEIICVDDGSTDGTQAFVVAVFPSVALKCHEKSVGPTACRNEGALIATGEFLLTLDDDCVLARRDSVETALDWFDESGVGAVTLPFVNMPGGGAVMTGAPDPDQVFVTSNYYGGMVMFRRSIYLAIGGYRTAYFMQTEEADLAARLMNCGWLIRNGSGVLIHHFESPIRDRDRRWRLGARNSILYAFLNVPTLYLLIHLLHTIGGTGAYAMRQGALRSVLLGFAEAIPVCRNNWKERAPVSFRVYQTIRLLRRHGPQPINRIKESLLHA